MTLAKGGVSADCRRHQPQTTAGGNRGSKHLGTLARFDWHRLASDRGLVDRRLPGEHLAVDRDVLAWSHNHRFANTHLRDRNFDGCAIALDAGGLRCERGQVLDCFARLLGGELLGVCADAHEEHDHNSSRPLAHGQCRQRTKAHQRV